MKKECAIAVSMVLGSVLIVAPAQAGDIENGRKLARKCSVCHGPLGLGKDPEVPHIAGQPAFYLEKSLFDYKTGKRQDRRMTLMAKPLSKKDIKDLAAWFSSIKLSVKPPEN